VKDLHLTPIAGSAPHTNPHTWYYGGDAMFVDALSYGKLTTTSIKSYCVVLAAFIEHAFAIQVTKFSYKKDSGGKYFLLS
jgi:hypothetical protein